MAVPSIAFFAKSLETRSLGRSSIEILSVVFVTRSPGRYSIVILRGDGIVVLIVVSVVIGRTGRGVAMTRIC